MLNSQQLSARLTLHALNRGHKTKSLIYFDQLHGSVCAADQAVFAERTNFC